MVTRFSQPMPGRDIAEEHRTATPLELFYDLIFVVAIANVASAFHHEFLDGHIRDATVSFGMVFLAIWWAWNQYSWFASSFDNNSLHFRLGTLWQMVGALVLASGVDNAFGGDFSVLVLGYVIIRSSSVMFWVKVARDNPHLRVTGRRYAIGILMAQIGWVTLLFLPFSYFAFVGLWLFEFLVPYFAESHTQTHFHPEHIEERHGLMTIIVLGESILASTISFDTLLDHFTLDVLFVSIGSVLTLFSAWWLYFNNTIGARLRDKRTAFEWGYGHLLIFAPAAAIGALVSVNVDVLTDHGSISLATAGFGFTVAVALCLTGVWLCHDRILAEGRGAQFFLLAVAGGALFLGLLPHAVLTTGILMVVAVAFRHVRPLDLSSRVA